MFGFALLYFLVHKKNEALSRSKQQVWKIHDKSLIKLTQIVCFQYCIQFPLPFPGASI